MSTRPDFTLLQLQYFEAAATEGSMTAASRVCMVSQSAISSAIAQLERQLHVQLFVRQRTKRLALTEAGRRFLVEATNLLSHAMDVAETARGLGEDLAGELAVGCFSTLGPFLAAPLFGAYRDQYRRVTLNLVEGETDGLVEHLLSGRVEIALMYNLGLPHTLEAEVLAEAKPYVILPAGHPLTVGRDAIWLEDLVDEELVVLDLPVSRDYFLALAKRRGQGNLEGVRHRSANFETVRSLVANGYGYAILNQRPVVDTTYDGGQVVALQLRDDLAGVPITLVHVRGVRLTRKAATFANLCRSMVPGIFNHDER